MAPTSPKHEQSSPSGSEPLASGRWADSEPDDVPQTRERLVDRWAGIRGDQSDDLADVLPLLSELSIRTTRDLSPEEVTNSSSPGLLREHRLLRVIDSLHRKSQADKDSFAAHIERLKNDHADALVHATSVVPDLTKQLKQLKKASSEPAISLSEERMKHADELTKQRAAHEVALKAARKDATDKVASAEARARRDLLNDITAVRARERATFNEMGILESEKAKLAVELSSLAERKAEVQAMVDRIAEGEAAPNDFGRFAKRQYEQGTKSVVDKDHAEAEKTRRDYTRRVQKLKGEEEHLAQLVKVVESISSASAATEYVKNKEGVAARKNKAQGAEKKGNGSAATVSKDTSAPVTETITMSRQAFDAAKAEAAKAALGPRLLSVMRSMAAYILMYEGKLLKTEEEKFFPGLRDGSFPTMAHDAAYALKMQHLRSAHTATPKDRANIKAQEVLFQQPTGKLSPAMYNWFKGVVDGAALAERDFKFAAGEGQVVSQ
ncbi:hypothetical protein J4E86_006912 [Alternaria arbusti]|uniref:uncharacterized protein n=1 Tax=Alternaria arbusti TaxID=232088 RepID=UPI00221F3EEB|nr:uncharacterized protein J4E86_006912 [Alternaria arbusti]KAI4953369.1 hypothetical protein J4E86_006912 [Alternaria arbusti]